MAQFVFKYCGKAKCTYENQSQKQTHFTKNLSVHTSFIHSFLFFLVSLENQKIYISQVITVYTGDTKVPMNIRYTKHAREQIVARGITEKAVEEGIQRGSKSLQGQKILSEYRYYVVVYKKINNIHYIITVKPRW